MKYSSSSVHTFSFATLEADRQREAALGRGIVVYVLADSSSCLFPFSWRLPPSGLQPRRRIRRNVHDDDDIDDSDADNNDENGDNDNDQGDVFLFV